MTLAIKLAIIAALILSIFIPFGYFLHGERTKKRYKQMCIRDRFNRAILKEILEETYEIIEADGGNEALHKIDEYGMKISLVLLDIIMPEKDGFEVLKYMEEERLISDIPVIIISSEDSANYIRRAYEMGVSD